MIKSDLLNCKIHIGWVISALQLKFHQKQPTEDVKSSATYLVYICNKVVRFLQHRHCTLTYMYVSPVNRWEWLHQRLSHGAILAWRQTVRNRRRHKRSSPAHYRTSLQLHVQMIRSKRSSKTVRVVCRGWTVTHTQGLTLYELLLLLGCCWNVSCDRISVNF